MANITIKVGGTAGAVGRDQPGTLAGLQAAWAAIPADVVGSGNSYIIELYNDAEFVLSDQWVLSGKTTDASHTITIRPAVGHSFVDNPNVLTNALVYNQANGVAIKSTVSYTDAINAAAQSNVLIWGLQAKRTGSGNGAAIGVGPGNTIDSNLVEVPGNQAGHGYCGISAGRANVRNNYVILTGQTACGFVAYSPAGNTGPSTFENNTVVRKASITGGTAIAYTADSVSQVVVNCAAFNAAFSDINFTTGFNNASDGVITFGTNNKQNLVFANQFVNTDTDFRGKAGSDLIDAGKTPSPGNTQTISGTRQQGTSADIGAWEYTSAVQAPTAVITAINVVGTTVTISGTFTGGATSGMATLTKNSAAGNNAVAQGPSAISIGAGTFTVSFANCKIGRYDASVTVSNASYFNIPASNTIGPKDVVGPQALSVVQDAIDGQVLTIHGTCTAAVSGNLTVPPAATNPNGAAQQSAVLTINTGVTPNTYTVSATLAPGNYDPGILTFTNADGTSLPQAGTAAVAIVGIAGNPVAPPGGSSTDTTAPVMVGTLSQSAVTQSSFTVTWQAATDDVAVAGYEVSADGGINYSSVGNVLTYTKTGATANTAYSVKVRAFDAAGNKATPLSATVTTLAAPVDTTPPVMQGSVVTSNVTQTSFTATWQAATDAVGVTGYEYSVNGAAYISNGTSLTVNVQGLTANTAYTFNIRAYDAAANRSTPLSAQVTTPAVPGDTTAPVMTGTVSVTSPTQSSLTLSWSAATDNVAVTGYERSIDGGTNYSSVGLVTTITLTGLSPSTTYPIRVRALDAAGNRSNVISGSGTTSAFVLGTATASVSLAVSMSAQYRANIEGLQWAWYDSAMMFGTPIDTGNVLSVDRDGAILIQMPDSAKTVGQTGWMVITDLDEVNNVRYRVFSGAVVVR